jgi:hypothetical protein
MFLLYFLVFSFGWVSYCNPKRHDYYIYSRKNFSLLLLFHAKSLSKGARPRFGPTTYPGTCKGANTLPATHPFLAAPDRLSYNIYYEDKSSVVDTDPASGAFLTPGSVIRIRDPRWKKIQIQDPGRTYWILFLRT